MVTKNFQIRDVANLSLKGYSGLLKGIWREKKEKMGDTLCDFLMFGFGKHKQTDQMFAFLKGSNEYRN